MTEEPQRQFTGDIVDDSVLMISADNIDKTIIQGSLDGNDVYVLAGILESDDKGTLVFPIGIIMNDDILDRLVLPEGITEVPPPIPMNGAVDG